MKILFIGNSYTYYNDMPKIFENLANENGKSVYAFAVTKGGRNLYENLDPCDENFKKIEDFTKSEKCDILFLQEQSYLPIKDFEAFQKGASALGRKVNAKRTVLYATWGRKEGCKLLSELMLSSAEMTYALHENYKRLATEMGAELSPVGLCFKYISLKYPEHELYNQDLSHPSYFGSAVAAVCHYYTVFGEMPSTYTSLALDSVQTDVIRKAIKSINQE